LARNGPAGFLSNTIAHVHILLIEDDTDAGAFLAKGLREGGFSVEHVTDAREALFRTTEGRYDAIVTDRMLPHLDGLEILKFLRQRGNSTPVLVMSALGSVDERVRGLREGGDDYLVKPFAPAELLARVHALLRRRTPSSEGQSRLTYADLSLDPVTRETSRGGRAFPLTPTEFSLLEYLMSHPRQVLVRHLILEEVWGYDFGGDDNVLEVYVGYLRRKTEEGGEPRLIQTVRGVGYVLREE